MPTKIDYVDEVWNPVTGCSKGCSYCYARRQAQRFKGRFGYPADDPFRVTLHPDRLDQPSHWRKPRRILVCSMGDLFDPAVPGEFIFDALVVMQNTPWHTFLLLTKQAERMAREFAHIGPLFQGYQREWPIRNVWLGASIPDQPTADRDIPILLRIPGKHWISAEPLLQCLDICASLHSPRCGWHPSATAYERAAMEAARRVIKENPCICHMSEDWYANAGHLATEGKGKPSLVDWVVCGPQTGPGAKPCDPAWIESLREQCKAAGVPFWRKNGLPQEVPSP